MNFTMSKIVAVHRGRSPADFLDDSVELVEVQKYIGNQISVNSTDFSSLEVHHARLKMDRRNSRQKRGHCHR
jgi:hypothetical protein